MVKRLLSILFHLIPAFLIAQPFGNEWVNYDQTYYRLQVWQDGVYRIPFSTLSTAIPDLGSRDPREFQVFGRGQQIPIYIEGEEDGTWDENDFIEFYGKKNDGWFDAGLYPNANAHSNPHHSLFTDTAAYFVTFSSEEPALRLNTTNDLEFTSYPNAPWFLSKNINQLTSSYYFGRTNFNNGTDPEYTDGEGWNGPVFPAPISNQITNLPSQNFIAAGPPSTLNIVYKTVSNHAWVNDHRYQLVLGTQSIDTLLEGHGTRRFSLTIPSNTLGAATTPFRFSYPTITTNTGVVVTSNSVFSNYEWTYPHNFNLENKSSFRMFIPNNTAGEKYSLAITNFNAGGTPVFLYDLSNNRRVNVTPQGNTFRVVIPNDNNEYKECFISAQSQFITINTLNAINHNPAQPGKFTNYRDFNGAQYLIVTSKIFAQEAQQYRIFRNQKYSTQVVFVEELYDQFGYGILKHSLALKKFFDFGLESWNEKPEFLLLMGKSISTHFTRYDPTVWNQNLVPTFGFPSCDLLLTSGLGENTLPFEPGLATGRIAAKTGADILSYLNKAQDYESAQPGLWMKQVMHFGGGISATEQNQYRNYLNTYKNKVVNPYFGGQVYTYEKTSSAPIEQTTSAVIADYINNGVSVMTFFGHATGSGFDVSIDNPANYNNQGKYPFLIGNSCFAGDIHQPSGLGFSLSEEFVLIPNRGTIGFIASVSLGIPSQLHTYTDTLYKYFCKTYYGEPMGKNMKRTIRAIHSNDPFRKSVMLETTLHGDPAIPVNSFLLPDYQVSAPKVYFNPADVTTEIDSFSVNIIIENVGRAIDDEVSVEVVRNFPNTGLTTTYNKIITGLYYRDTLTIKMPVTDLVKGGVGINTFAIRVDPLNQINELSEVNNNVNVELLIRSADIVPVWPYDFALVPQNTVTLKASTGDPFAPVRDYVFEIDTTDLFNSPAKRRQVISSAGGVVTWTPPITFPDSMVYFWRVSPDSVAGGNYRWREKSFQHIPGKRGWAQDHFFQFKDNTYNQLNYLRPTREFDFVTNAKEIKCNAYGFPWVISELWATSFAIDAEVWATAGCSLDGAMYIAVIDSVNLTPWLSPQNCWDQGNQFGQFNSTCACKNGNRMANFVFRNENSTTEMAAMRDMLNSVPNGNYILAYTWIYGKFQTWDESVIQAFENLGADSIRYLPNEYPYIFFVKKGHPETKVELIADSANADLQLNAPMFNSWVSGSFSSQLIGPGTGWDTLSWIARKYDNPLDSIRISVTGITANGVEELITNQAISPIGEVNLAPLIEGKNYTYLRLNAFMRDDSLRSPVQLDRWQITYDPVPEAALNPLAGFHFYRDTLQQGDSLHLAIAIQNISELPMDSMLVAYWLMDKDRNIFPLEYPRQKPLSPDEILFDTLNVSTTTLNGAYTIWIEANPNFDQREQYRFNNIGNWRFFVTTDNINPLLDVTFDAVHILNGDIISPKPEIVIQLRDENPFLALDDTSSFRLYLRRPSQQAAQPIHFGTNPNMVFIPGSLPKNKARIEWRPFFTEDGKYDFIVKATDRSQNASGSVEYKISFEVINKSTITQIMNYPNPFSTRTHFVFTLTGSEIPDYFRIQIMTITGRVVRDIRKEELGPIRIGRNMTEFAWDGKDEFGDALGNGVYLYRVMTSIKGTEVERRETNADTFFKQGLGKMYLMR